MKLDRGLLLLGLIVISATSSACRSVAQEQPKPQQQQIKATFVHLGPGVPGVLYEPVKAGEKGRIGIFVMHSGADYLTFSACTELSERGYRVLCANNTTSKGGTSDDGNLDRILLDAKLGVAYLRKDPEVRKVVLLGHSGGGTLMSAYQDIAENGTKACQGLEKIHKCPDSLAGLPAADGLMLIDSNWGLAEMMLFSLDPAVMNVGNGLKVNSELDLFNPKNGFNLAGSTYSEAFIHEFLGAEGKRNDQLIQTALDRVEAIKAGKGNFNDDESFTVAGANFKGANNRLFAQDIRLMSHTQKAWPLLRSDGTIVTQIVHTVRVPQNTVSTSPSMDQGALTTTVRNFLSTYAIRVTGDYGYDEDSVHGIEWSSTYSSPPGNVGGVTVPLLTMGMTGHWEYLASETIFQSAKSADKTLVFVDGATHGYTTCTKCERYPGEFGDTEKTTYDYVDLWLSKSGRFL